MLTIGPSLTGNESAWSSWTWKGIQDVPAIFKKYINCLSFDPSLMVDNVVSHLSVLSCCGRTRLNKCCHLFVALVSVLVNTSSGIDTSRTISNSFSFSLSLSFMLILIEHNFFMERIMFGSQFKEALCP